MRSLGTRPAHTLAIPVLVLTVAGAWVSGCAPSSAPSATATASASTTPIAGPSAPSPEPAASPTFDPLGVPISAATAWGPVETARLRVAVEAGRHFVFSGSGTRDGRYLIGSLLRDDFLDTRGTVPGDVVLYEVATGELVTLGTMQELDSQVVSASADENWVAWLEADDFDAYNWHLFAWDRATGRVHEVARADRHAGRPVPGPLTFIWLSHGQLVWGQGVRTGVVEGSLENAVVRRADLATGDIVTVAESAGSPAFDWPWIAWEAFPAGADPRTEFANLETGWSRSMQELPRSMALDGSSAAFSAADLHSIWLIEDITDPASAVEIARGIDNADYLQWPTVNERIVAWVQDGRSVVFDRAQRRLVELPPGPGLGWGTVAGPNLVWTETAPSSVPVDHPDWFVVADTRSFPAAP